MIDRFKEIEAIKSKGFNMVQEEDLSSYHNTVNFNKIRVGSKNLDDAVLNLGSYKKVNRQFGSKEFVLKAIHDGNLQTMREISDFYYRISGIYNRIIRYMAYMFRYDWFVTPYVKDRKSKNEKIIEIFDDCLLVLDNFNAKQTFSDISINVLKDGVYYGYRVETPDGAVLQELPYKYCRTRYSRGNVPAVEFNMKYFDEAFSDVNYRMRVIKMFPKEFAKGYALYKRGKLAPDYPGDTNGWYLLDPEMTVKFNTNKYDHPPFISVIPLLLDLDEAQDIDRKKTLQRLLKILVQKMPLDKNGDLIFDVDEAQQLHNNAVQMLGKAIGLDVLTTFADVTVEDMSHTTAATSQTDDLERVERQVFNESGVSQMLFNTDGNVALEKSILNDAATMDVLRMQYETFLNKLIKKYNSQPKKVVFRVQILPTTIYNYQELSKIYKEQTQIGFSKMLPQVALGQSQSSILANAYFENNVLNLFELFIPPLMSSVMNKDMLGGIAGLKNGGGAAAGEESKAGRKELPNDQKSEKTIQNKESMN